MAGNVSLVATGDRWVGRGVRSSSAVILELLDNVERHVAMTAYVINNWEIVKAINKALDRGITIEIFIYGKDKTMLNDAVQRIKDMDKRYDYLHLVMVEDEVLHAKVVVADERSTLIGSANLTYGGMVTNHELGFLVEDVGVAQRAIDLMRRLA